MLVPSPGGPGPAHRTAGGPARYEARGGDNHHHIVCRGCGAIADVDCATVRRPASTEPDHGFEVDEAEVTFWGLCPACQQSRPRTDNA